jgi:hypothetical protein
VQKDKVIMADSGQTFHLTMDHLHALREMIFVWVDLEAGAPGMWGYGPTTHRDAVGTEIEPYTPLGIQIDLCRILGLEEDPFHLGTETQERLDQFHASMGTALEIALDAAEIVPGDYTYPNFFALMPHPDVEHLMPYHIEVVLPDLFEDTEFAFEGDHVPVPTGEMIAFHLTADHVRLLRALRVDWSQRNGYVGIELKRPYGDMTYFEIDMADILGIPFARDSGNEPNFTKEQRIYLNALHNDMLFAVPTLLRNGTLRPGQYQIERDVWVSVQ